jgi:hypothetical protein
VALSLSLTKYPFMYRKLKVGILKDL